MADETSLKPVRITIKVETEGLPSAASLAPKPSESKPGGKPPEPGRKEAEQDRRDEERERKPRPNRPERRPPAVPAAAARRGSALGAVVRTFLLAEIVKVTAPIVAGAVQETVSALNERLGDLAGATVGDALKETARKIAQIEAVVVAVIGATGDAGAVALAQRALTGQVDSKAITQLGLQRVAIRTAEADIGTIRRIAGQELAGKAGAAAAIDAIRRAVGTSR